MLKLKAVEGDITKIAADAVVNAANSTLLGGGGVDGAIHRAGGPAILAECKVINKEQGGCPTGEAVITTAGKLPARYVIHTVGPVWKGGRHDEERLLANCYRNSLLLAQKHSLKKIIFPNISTGAYGFPKILAAKTAIKAVFRFVKANNDFEEIIFVCFSSANYEIYKSLLGKEAD